MKHGSNTDERKDKGRIKKDKGVTQRRRGRRGKELGETENQVNQIEIVASNWHWISGTGFQISSLDVQVISRSTTFVINCL
jgi:hypothetical protein